MNDREHFAIKYGAFRPLLSVLGLGPRFSGVVLDANRLTVKMGWGFTTNVPRSAIASAQQTGGIVAGIGIHGWRGRWLVNGAASGLVMVRFDPRQRTRVVGFPVRLVALCLSLEEPDRFVAEVTSAA